MTSVLIVGCVRLYREGLADFLARDAEFDVLGTAGGPREAVAEIDALQPDIVLVDLIQDGLDLVRGLATRRPRTRVVALAVDDSEPAVISCAEAGVAGYVTRDGSLDDLRNTIASVGRGESLASPRMTAALLRRVADLAAELHAGGESAPLTAREREVIELVDRGLTNKEIARTLHIELATVKNHMHRILEKLQVKRREEAAAQFRAGRVPFS